MSFTFGAPTPPSTTPQQQQQQQQQQQPFQFSASTSTAASHSAHSGHAAAAGKPERTRNARVSPTARLIAQRQNQHVFAAPSAELSSYFITKQSQSKKETHRAQLRARKEKKKEKRLEVSLAQLRIDGEGIESASGEPPSDNNNNTTTPTTTNTTSATTAAATTGVVHNTRKASPIEPAWFPGTSESRPHWRAVRQLKPSGIDADVSNTVGASGEQASSDDLDSDGDDSYPDSDAADTDYTELEGFTARWERAATSSVPTRTGSQGLSSRLNGRFCSPSRSHVSSSTLAHFSRSKKVGARSLATDRNRPVSDLNDFVPEDHPSHKMHTATVAELVKDQHLSVADRTIVQLLCAGAFDLLKFSGETSVRSVDKGWTGYQSVRSLSHVWFKVLKPTHNAFSLLDKRSRAVSTHDTPRVQQSLVDIQALGDIPVRVFGHDQLGTFQEDGVLTLWSDQARIQFKTKSPASGILFTCVLHFSCELLETAEQIMSYGICARVQRVFAGSLFPSSTMRLIAPPTSGWAPEIHFMFGKSFKETVRSLLLCWVRHRNRAAVPLAKGETRESVLSKNVLAPVPRDGLYVVIHMLAQIASPLSVAQFTSKDC